MPAAAVAHEFSIAPCGPFDRLLARAGLKGDDPSRLLLRAAQPAIAVWVPLALFAVSSLVAGAVGTRILHEGARLATYQWPLAAYVGMAIVVGVAPLALFWRPMRIAKEAGMLDYGTFASRYAQDFHGRWIDAGAGKAQLEASGDVQGLADVGGSFERVYAMRLLPITLKTAAAFAVAAAAPMLPLLLTVMPLRDLLKLFMQAMF